MLGLHPARFVMLYVALCVLSLSLSLGVHDQQAVGFPAKCDQYSCQRLTEFIPLANNQCWAFRTTAKPPIVDTQAVQQPWNTTATGDPPNWAVGTVNFDRLEYSDWNELCLQGNTVFPRVAQCSGTGTWKRGVTRDKCQ